MTGEEPPILGDFAFVKSRSKRAQSSTLILSLEALKSHTSQTLRSYLLLLFSSTYFFIHNMVSTCKEIPKKHL